MPLFPGATVETLASRYRNCIHAYHGIDAWDAAGERLLYVGFEDTSRADLVVRDLASGAEMAIGSTNAVNYHTAAMQRWALDDAAVVFETNDADGVIQPCLVLAESGGRTEVLREFRGYEIRHVLAHGHIAYAQTRPVGGLAHVARLDLSTGQREVLFDANEIVALLAPDRREEGVEYFFSHPLARDDEEWMLFKLLARGSGDRPGREITFFTRHLASGRTIEHPGVSGHPYWDPVTGKILNIVLGQTDDQPRYRELVLMDPATAEMDLFVPEWIEGPGHPSISPNGRWAATDSFWEGREAMVYLFDRKTGGKWRLATLDHTWGPQKVYDPSQVWRGQPHPVWSPDSRALLVNCNDAATRYHLRILRGFAHPLGAAGA